MTAFVDTGVLFARAFTRDGKHAAAKRVLEGLGVAAAVTSDYVLIECWGLLNRRVGRDAAMRFWRGIRSAPIRVEFATPADLERAEAIADTWPDQSFSIVDCTSFAVMERMGCSRAATFDSDFAIYRYGPDRTRAFEIVR